MKKIISALGIATLLAAGMPASADVVIGSYTFADNAFADTVASSGTFNTFIGSSFGGTLADVLTDKSVSSGAFSGSVGSYVDLGFTDNTVFNGAGVDLVLFEEGIPSTLRVTINGTTLDYLPVSINITNISGYNVNAAVIDLAAFGISDGGTIGTLRVDMGYVVANGAQPVLLEVGALNSRTTTNDVPEPSTWALAALAIAGLAVSRRRTS